MMESITFSPKTFEVKDSVSVLIISSPQSKSVLLKQNHGNEKQKQMQKTKNNFRTFLNKIFK